jgi:hypothetical protein
MFEKEKKTALEIYTDKHTVPISLFSYGELLFTDVGLASGRAGLVAEPELAGAVWQRAVVAVPVRVSGPMMMNLPAAGTDLWTVLLWVGWVRGLE